MRLVKDDTDCAGCLCRVCARNFANDCKNVNAPYADCAPCEHCYIGETFVVDVEEDCLGPGYLKDEW